MPWGGAVVAQHVVNFEGASETKTGYASGAVTLSGIGWELNGVLIGTTASDYRVGARSARLRAHDGAALTMLGSKANGMGTISFTYRRFGTDGAQQPWAVEYSVNDGETWIPVGPSITATADTLTFSQEVNVPGAVRIRVRLTTTPGTTGDRRMNIDDITITDYPSAPSLKGAPDAHASNFLASHIGQSSLTLSWASPGGAVVPDGYLIQGRSPTGAYAPIANGAPVANDTDWGNGNYALNVAHTAGSMSATVAGLAPNTSYHFAIWPYTNSGSSILYKTDPPPPEVQVTTLAVPPITALENGSFEAWDGGLPTGWAGPRTDMAAAAVVESPEAWHGARSVRLMEPTATNRRFTSRPYAITANQSYRLSYFAKGQGSISNGFYRSGAYSSYTPAITLHGAEGWVPMEYRFSHTQSAQDVELIFRVHSTVADGHVQIDHVIVEEVFNLSLTSQPASGGTTTGAGFYAHGQGAAIAAQAHAGFVFSHWADAHGQPIALVESLFPMPAATTTLQAVFAQVFAVSLTVSDGAALPIEGAQVFIDGQLAGATSPAGTLSLALANGSYALRVSRDGFADGLGSFAVSGSALSLSITLLPPGPALHPIAFTVTDSALNPVAGAGIALASGGVPVGAGLVTDALGRAAAALADGAYTYAVAATGFQPISSTPFAVAGGALSIGVVMRPAPAPVPIARWHFDDPARQALVNASLQLSDYPPDQGQGAIALTGGAALSLSSGSAFIAGAVGQAVNSRSWHAGAGAKAWGVTLNTAGFQGLHVSSRQRSSGTGPRHFQLQFSTNGTTWADVPGGGIATAENFTAGVLHALPLPPACDHQPTLHLRWLMASNVSVRAGTGTHPADDPVQAAGTSRLDEVVITGTPAPIPHFPVTLTVVDPAGIPLEGVAVSLGPAAAGATDGQGAITLSLPNGQHPYTLTKKGYLAGQGGLLVNGRATAHTHTLHPRPILISATIRVVNASDTPIAGAEVTLTAEGVARTQLTGVDGLTQFQGLPARQAVAYAIRRAGHAPIIETPWPLGAADTTITVALTPLPSVGTEITHFGLPGQTGPAVINALNNRIDIEVLAGTDVTALTPSIGVSAGATVSPAAGVPQNFTNPITYTVTAPDGVTVRQWTVTVAVQPHPLPILPISAIQRPATAGGSSPFADQEVITLGVVTARHYSHPGGSYLGFFIQDSAKAWNGLYVLTSAHTPAPGDRVRLRGTVTEEDGLTLLQPLSGLEALGGGHSLPLPVEVSTLEANAEAWEGVLVRVQQAICADNDAGFGMVRVNDGSGDLLVGNDLFAGTYANNRAYSITGIRHWAQGMARLLPRSASDVAQVTQSPAHRGAGVAAYPNPFAHTLTMLNLPGQGRLVITNLIGKAVFSAPLDGSTRMDIATDGWPTGIYLISIATPTGQREVRRVTKE